VHEHAPVVRRGELAHERGRPRRERVPRKPPAPQPCVAREAAPDLGDVIRPPAREAGSRPQKREERGHAHGGPFAELYRQRRRGPLGPARRAFRPAMSQRLLNRTRVTLIGAYLRRRACAAALSPRTCLPMATRASMLCSRPPRKRGKRTRGGRRRAGRCPLAGSYSKGLQSLNRPTTQRDAGNGRSPSPRGPRTRYCPEAGRRTQHVYYSAFSVRMWPLSNTRGAGPRGWRSNSTARTRTASTSRRA